MLILWTEATPKKTYKSHKLLHKLLKAWQTQRHTKEQIQAVQSLVYLLNVFPTKLIMHAKQSVYVSLSFVTKAVFLCVFIVDHGRCEYCVSTD